jgi:hypothetical protein
MNQLTFYEGGPQRVNAECEDITMMGYAISNDTANVLIEKSADTSEAKANSVLVRTIRFKAVDSAGNVHRWYNKGGYTVAMTPSAGTLVGSPTGVANCSFVNGVLEITVTANAACHNNVGDNTVVLTAQAIGGVTPTGATLTHTMSFT